MIVPSKLELFIERMQQNDEQMRWGFELLLKRDDFEQFFDVLEAAGLFAVEKNLGPTPSTKPGYVHIPYWPALDYLKACAERAGEKSNFPLADKLMNIIRRVTTHREPDGTVQANYHTNRVFAEIFGKLPKEATTVADMDLIKIWLEDKYDRGLVCNELDKGAMKLFLSSDRDIDLEKALHILCHLTEIVPKEDKDEFSVIADAYWLKEFIDHYARNLGERIGAGAANIFFDRLNRIFSSGTRSRHSYVYRPAIEEHPQNHSWRDADNCMVEGLREVLLGWVDAASTSASAYISNLLTGDLEIARRIALHVIDYRWNVLESLFNELLSPHLFRHGHLHELYWLLHNHFSTMSVAMQSAVLNTIQGLMVPRGIEDSEHYRQVRMAGWLSAIKGKGNEEVDQTFRLLTSGEEGVKISKHPDFLSYMESITGDGSSPYQSQELVAFAKDGSLIDSLNGFQPTGKWDGPTVRSLVSALEEAMLAEPEPFFRILPTFIKAKYPYQYGVINGIRRLWEDPSSGKIVNWDDAWENILCLLEKILFSDVFWSEIRTLNSDWEPTKDWIPPVVADLLRAGTSNDEHAYPIHLLPRTRALLVFLLQSLESEDCEIKDPMTYAINSSRGKVIEALFSNALRTCRVADKKNKNHNADWEQLQPIFDSELEKCQGGNFEFSTLAAAYLGNIEYLDVGWMEKNISRLFSVDFPENFRCAISGLAYANPTKKSYALLAAAGIIDYGIKFTKEQWEPKSRLIGRVALAYLWGDEELTSSRFLYWFASKDIDALIDVTEYFWSVSNQSLTSVQRCRVNAFWGACLDWAKSLNDYPVKLISHLSKLSCYIEQISEREAFFLLTVAAYCSINHNSTEFIRNLDRLASEYPLEIQEALAKLIEADPPTYDYNDHLHSIVKKVAESGYPERAMVIADSLRSLPGMRELYTEILYPSKRN